MDTLPLPNISPLLTREAAAAYLGISPATLAKWASEKTQPLPFVKVGRLVRYRITDLDAFIAHSVIDQ